MKTSFSSQKQSLFLTLVLLGCFKCLYIMILSNRDLLTSRPTLFYFVSQNVYLNIPRSIAHYEDCSKKHAHRVAEYRYRVRDHISSTCEERRRGGEERRGTGGTLKSRFGELPSISLNNMVIDKHRNYLYTGVLGAMGTKWSKLMVAVNKVDGGNDNLVKVAKFIQTHEGKQYMSNSENLFKFYFVRNPLDRVISGYYYYFQDFAFARAYQGGVPLKELININTLEPEKLTNITFEHYLKWVIFGDSALKHFGVQHDIVQPCFIKYTLNGIFEVLTMERLVVANNVLDLKTPRNIFTTIRDLTYLTNEARELVKSVDPGVMRLFYDKYRADYETWNYSKPGNWWYPYPGLLKHMRLPNPSMKNNDWPKVKDIKEEDLVMLEELKGGDQRVERSRGSTVSGSRAVSGGWCLLLSGFYGVAVVVLW